jgi:hypothetical protein
MSAQLVETVESHAAVSVYAPQPVWLVRPHVTATVTSTNVGPVAPVVGAYNSGLARRLQSVVGGGLRYVDGSGLRGNGSLQPKVLDDVD